MVRKYKVTKISNKKCYEIINVIKFSVFLLLPVASFLLIQVNFPMEKRPVLGLFRMSGKPEPEQERDGCGFAIILT